jgi:hypothetical protein
MEYLGAWETLIHEKNLKSEISCQTPFKEGQRSKDFAPRPPPVICLTSDTHEERQRTDGERW